MAHRQRIDPCRTLQESPADAGIQPLSWEAGRRWLPAGHLLALPLIAFLLLLLAVPGGGGAGMPARVLMAEDASPGPRPSGALLAGVARTDITPEKPVTLSGYASRKELSRGVHDPLSARAVAFERDGRRLVLVSTDVIGFYGDAAERLRKAILDAVRLEPQELFLAAIHTHSAPQVVYEGENAHPNNAEYTRWLETRLVEVVRAALAAVGPARIGVGTGASPVGANRRERVSDAAGNPRIVLGRNPSGPTDRDVQVLQIQRAADGTTAGILFAYATHSTSMGPGNHLVSGDVHGLAEQFVEKHLGGGMIAPGFAGASGDIDPWFRVLPEFKTTNGWIPEPILMGTMLGEEVVHVAQRVKTGDVDGPLRSAITTLLLPGKAEGGDRAGAEEPKVPMTITVGRVGDVALVGLGAEVFHEIGKAIKSASPFPCTFVITHCNGAAGYLPTRESFAEGGYEIQTSRLAPRAADIVVGEVARLLREL